MVFIERHLVNLAENAPIHEMGHKTGKSRYPIALDFVKCLFNVTSCNLGFRIVNWLFKARFSCWSCCFLCVFRSFLYRLEGSRFGVFIGSYISITFIFRQIVGKWGTLDSTLCRLFKSTLSFFPLLRGLVRNNVNGEVFDKFWKIAHYVTHSNV